MKIIDSNFETKSLECDVMASKLKIVRPGEAISIAELRRDLRRLHQLDAEIAALGNVRSKVRGECRALRKRLETIFDLVGVGSKLGYSKDDLMPVIPNANLPFLK